MATQAGLPPAPRMPRPIQTAIWSRQAQWMLVQSRRRLGPMFTLEIAYEGKWVVVSDPEVVKQVFTGDPKIFHAGEGNEILRPLLGKFSLLTLDDGAHMSQRKLLLPPFHGRRMAGYEESMREIAGREIESWPTGVPYQLRPRMQAMTLDIILATVFGIEDGERLGPLRESLRAFLDMLTDPRFIVPLLALGPDRIRSFPPFRRRVDRVAALIGREIADRRLAADLEERDDILSLLVAARHEDGSSVERPSEIAGDDGRGGAKHESGQPMSDAEIHDELLTLLVAGHETTATALSWAIERLVRHPDKLGRLRDEVAAGEDAYLTATIQETLRLRPVIVIVNRGLTEAIELGGYDLPAGVSVVPSIHLVHRDPTIYPEPDRFLPERFLETPPGTYTWIPFGGGVRRCLGAAFAQQEMAIVLEELVARRVIEPADPAPERNMRRAITETPRRNTEVVLS
jgi:cytochrome P450